MKELEIHGLPSGMMLWEVHYMSQVWSNGSYGGPQFAGWDPIDEWYYVLAHSRNQALKKVRKEVPELRKRLGKNEEIKVTALSLENLVAARDSSHDGRLGYHSTPGVAEIQLSLKADKNYRLGVCLIREEEKK